MSFKEKFAEIPTPLAGLALGIAGLGWCFENAVEIHGYGQHISAAIAGFLLTILIIKFIFYPAQLMQEAAHPVIGSVIPTFAMALMIVSSSLAAWNSIVAQSVWLIAVMFHLIFLSLFVYHRVKAFKMEHMVPSWFVPPVGIIVADVAFPGGALKPLATSLLYFGLSAYALMLPVMMYRLIFGEDIHDTAKPTIAIMAAPASLSLAGYLTIVSTPSPEMVALLAGIGILMTGVIYLAFMKLLKLPFSPGYAAFTFPMVIGATALFKTAHWMELFGLPLHSVAVVHHLAMLELIVATIIVAYVAFRYATFYLR